MEVRRLVYGVREVAIVLGRTEKAIYHDVTRENWNRVPPAVRLGRSVVWRKEDVENWLAAMAGQGQDESQESLPRPRRRGRPRKEDLAARRAAKNERRERA